MEGGRDAIEEEMNRERKGEGRKGRENRRVEERNEKREGVRK